METVEAVDEGGYRNQAGQRERITRKGVVQRFSKKLKRETPSSRLASRPTAKTRRNGSKAVRSSSGRGSLGLARNSVPAIVKIIIIIDYKIFF